MQLSPEQRLKLAAIYENLLTRTDARPAGYESHILMPEAARTILAERNFAATLALNNLLLQQARDSIDPIQLDALSDLLDNRLDVQRTSLARQQSSASGNSPSPQESLRLR